MQRSTNSAKLSAWLDKHLNSYAIAAGAAGVALLACSAPADARVICGKASLSLSGTETFPFNPAKLKFPPFNLAQTYLKSTSTLQQFVWNRAFFTPNTAGANDLLASNGLPAGLAAGAVIGPTRRFGKGNSYALLFTYGNYGGGTISRHHGNVPLGKVGYVGYKFLISGKDHFGWARLRVDIQKPHTVTKLIAFGYETVPAKPIHAGSCTSAEQSADGRLSSDGVHDGAAANASGNSFSGLLVESSRGKPKLASLGMLAGGFDGLSLWRRQQR